MKNVISFLFSTPKKRFYLVFVLNDCNLSHYYKNFKSKSNRKDLKNELGQSIQTAVQMLPNLVHDPLVDVNQQRRIKVPQQPQKHTLHSTGELSRHVTNLLNPHITDNAILFALSIRRWSKCDVFMVNFTIAKHYSLTDKLLVTLNTKIVHVLGNRHHPDRHRNANRPQGQE